MAINKLLNSFEFKKFYKEDYRIYSNKRRIWDKKANKRCTLDALTADIFALVIMKLSDCFHRVNFSRNSRFTISLVSVHRKINR